MKLAQDEQIMFTLKPSMRLLGQWAITKCAGIGVLTGVLAFMSAYFYFGAIAFEKTSRIDFLFSRSFILLCAGVGLAGFVFAVMYHRHLVKTITYVITNQRCVYNGGILRRVMHSVNFGKITDVELSQDLIEQILSIRTLSLFTAGTASVNPRAMNRPIAELTFAGLESAEDESAYLIEAIRNASRVAS